MNPDNVQKSAESQRSESRLRWRMSRRGFLVGMGVTAGGLVAAVAVGLPALRNFAGSYLSSSGPPASLPADPLLWFEVLADNRVRFYVTKVEMGQGVHTSLAQIGIEELGITWDRMEIMQATTLQGPADSFGTAGSNSVSSYWQPVREAAATLREMLRIQAAALMSVAASDLIAKDGGFEMRQDSAKRIEYGDIVNQTSDWQIPEIEPQLKSADEFEYVGKSILRVDLPDKISGRAIYGFDARVDGMLFGAVAKPPTIDATLRSASAGAVEGMPGVVKVIIAEDFAGVVATSRQEAWAARDALELEWDEGRAWQQTEIDEMVQVGGRGGVRIQGIGDADSILRNQTTLSASYRTPLAAHASMETQAALAEVSEEHVRVWISTQTQYSLQDTIAAALERPVEEVEIIPTYLGGGFGRKAGNEVGVEAARLAAAVNSPVHVGWTRSEEMRNGYFRPPTQHSLHAQLDASGSIIAMEHQQASGDVFFHFFPAIAGAVLGADFGAYRGATIAYEVPNKQTMIWRRQLPIVTAWWRGLGLLANTFAIESFMDEAAHLVQADPLAFRLAHLGEDGISQRLGRVLETAATAANWGQSLPPGHAQGIACCVDYDTVVAQVAQVSVDDDTGQINVHKVVAAIDPGLIVNPDGVMAQVEGSIMMGLSSALLEEIQIQDGRVIAGNFDRYPILTMNAAPAIETVLLQSGTRPSGVGEPPIGPAAPAVANAVYNATGVRLRQLPMTPERVKAAMATEASNL